MLSKVFYGVGALGFAAVALAVFVLTGGDVSRLRPHHSSVPNVKLVKVAPATYPKQVIFVVNSQAEADNLRAYGAGLSTLNAESMPADAKVTVLVAPMSGDDANVEETMARFISAHLDNPNLSLQLVDLR